MAVDDFGCFDGKYFRCSNSFPKDEKGSRPETGFWSVSGRRNLDISIDWRTADTCILWAFWPVIERLDC